MQRPGPVGEVGEETHIQLEGKARASPAPATCGPDGGAGPEPPASGRARTGPSRGREPLIIIIIIIIIIICMYVCIKSLSSI